MDNKLLCVVGATGLGKSALAAALAHRFGAEVVNADSMALYRGMVIGTATPSADEQALAPHHLFNVWDLSRVARVAEYQDQARDALSAIRGRDRHPVLVGGSGLYVRAVVDELQFPGTDPAIRARYEQELAERGPRALHAELARRDPIAAAAILPSNARRVVRALEVVELRGSFTAVLPRQDVESTNDTAMIGIRAERDVLDARIDSRVDAMFAAGFVDEVRGLAAQGLRDAPTASRALGYAQVLDYLDGQSTLDDAIELTKRATRRFARRQESWFGRDPRIQWFDVDAQTEKGALVDRVAEFVASRVTDVASTRE